MKLNLDLDSAQPITANLTTRAITGVLVPYGVIGRTSIGPLRVRAGSLTVAPTVFFLTDHDTTKPAGLLASHTDTATELSGVFTLPAGVAQADQVLAEAAAGLRPGLSIGLENVVTERGADGVPELVAGLLVECSSVVRPAFTGAAITDVAAHDTETESTSGAGAQPNPASEVSPEPEPEPEGEPTPEPTPNVPAPAAGELDTESGARPKPTEKDDPVDTDTITPAGAQAVAPRLNLTAAAPAALTLRAIANRVAALKGDTAQITAALADITTTQFPVAPQYVAELLGLVETGRPFTTAFSRDSLTSNQVQYRQWKTLPIVAEQLTEKAEIASAAAAWEWKNTAAKTFAGGNDVSLQEIWFDPSALTEYFRAAAEAYAIKADGYAIAQGVTNGTDVDAGAGATYAAMYLAGLAQLLTVGLAPDVVLAPSDLYLQAVTESLAAAAVGGTVPIPSPTFIANPALPAGVLIVGHSSAFRTWEITGAPVQMQVANVANAGLDVGVVGAIAAATVRPGGLAIVRAGGVAPLMAEMAAPTTAKK